MSGESSHDPSVDIVNTSLQWAFSILGFVFNIWIIVGMRRHRNRSGINFLLWALALIDFYFTLLIFLRFALVGTLIQVNLVDPDLNKWHARLEIFLRPMFVAVQLMTIWFVVALTRERHITVCQPNVCPSQNVFTKADAKRLYLILLFVCVAFCVPQYFQWFVISNETMSTRGYFITMTYVYDLGLYTAFAHVVPILTILILQCVIRASKKEEEVDSAEDPIQTFGPNYVAGTGVDHLRVSVQLVHNDVHHVRTYEVDTDRSLTNAITAVSLVFVICQIPWITIRLHKALGQPDTGAWSTLMLYMRGAENTALLINSASKCLFYSLFCPKLRGYLCHCRENSVDDEDDEEEDDGGVGRVPVHTVPKITPYGNRLETTF